MNTIFDDQRLGLRLMITMVIGFAVAGFLTWFMYGLIQFSEQKLDETARVHILDIVRVKRQESSVKKEQRASRPQIEDAPSAPAPNLNDSESAVDSIAISDIPIVSDVSVDMSAIGAGVGEGEFLPIVKVAPIYPMSASNKGIEGTCMVEYTVTASGATKNITVVETECEYSGFKKPSIDAAKRFKYKPRVMNGEAVEVHNVRNRFIFNLMDKKSGDKS